jgi:hypothetical protein
MKAILVFFGLLILSFAAIFFSLRYSQSLGLVCDPLQMSPLPSLVLACRCYGFMKGSNYGRPHHPS